MEEEKIILAVASSYDEKYYFNDEFNELPQRVKDEIKIASVLHTAEVGGIITILFNEEGNLIIEAEANEDDILYDEIGSHLKIKQLLIDKKELWEALEEYYKVFYLED